MMRTALVILMTTTGCLSSSLPGESSEDAGPTGPDGGRDIWGAPDVWGVPDAGPDVWSGPDSGRDVWFRPDGGRDVWDRPDSARPDVWDRPDSSRPDVWDRPDSARPDVWDRPDSGRDVWDRPDGGRDVWNPPDGGFDVWNPPDAGGPDTQPPVCGIPDVAELSEDPGNSPICSIVGRTCSFTRVGSTVRIACDGTTGSCTLASDCTCNGPITAGGLPGRVFINFIRQTVTGSAGGVSCGFTYDTL